MADYNGLTGFTMHPAEDTIRGWDRELKEAYATIDRLKFEAHRGRESAELTDSLQYFHSCVVFAPLLARIKYMFTGEHMYLTPTGER